MIKEIFKCIVSGFKYLPIAIYRHFKDDFDDFVNWLTTYD